MKELTYPELLSLPANSYTLVDVRDDVRVRYGSIPGSIHIPEDELKEKADYYAETLSPGKTLVLYCQSGIRTKALAETFEDLGRDVYSLHEGYVSYLRYIILSGGRRLKCRSGRISTGISSRPLPGHARLIISLRKGTTLRYASPVARTLW